jgi:type II secretion system protein N
MARRLVLLLVYGCYAFLLTGILLAVLFPRDRLAVWAERRVERRLPGFACRVGNVRYVHPFSLRFDQVALDNRAARVTIPMETLSVRFEAGWPIVAQAVSASLFGGSLESDISVDQSGRRIEMDNLSLSSVRLDDIDFLQKRLDRQIHGRLDLRGKMVVDFDRFDTMQFAGVVEIDSFATKLRRPVLGMRDISFNRVGADLRQQIESIELSAGNFDGELIGGTFMGRVEIEQPWQNSQIEIESGLVLKPALVENDESVSEIAAGLYRMYEEEVIPCRVAGTLKEPQFSFSREFESRLERVQ